MFHVKKDFGIKLEINYILGKIAFNKFSFLIKNINIRSNSAKSSTISTFLLV